MPIQRKAEEVVPNLLLGLETKVKDYASDGVAENSSFLSQKFMEIHKELQDMKDVFPRVKNWEKLVMEEFDLLEEEIADDFFEKCKVDEEIEKIEKKFEGMKKRISKIKDLNNPIKLPSIDSSTSVVLVVSDKPYKTSADWSKLSIEKNIFERAAMANLRISYDVLEFKLKLCLLCFSIFPENSVIKKRALIYWWIGEGLVSQGGDGKTAKEMGEGFFKDLIKKGMIKPKYKNKNQVVDSCTVHPWIRRMVILVAKEARFFDFDDSGNPTLNFSTTRTKAMRIVTKGELKTNDTSLKIENMLTLFNIDEHYLSFTREEFQKLKRVAVLQLGRWQDSTSHHIEIEKDEFLEGLGAQKHLKYLSLQGISRITELPASIGKLTNLKILDLRACHNLEKLPSGITYMKKLTHLDVSECYLLEHMPKGLESLVELQVLKGFVIGNSRSKDPCKLSALSTLTKLTKLSIYVGDDAIVEKPELGELQILKNLRILTIIWGGVTRGPLSAQDPAKPKNWSSKMRSATLTMLHLSMPENLEKLDLRCFPQFMLPAWLSPDKLKKLNRLYIRGGKLDSLVHDENHPWEVTVLRLKYLEYLMIEWSKLQTAFPKLVYLENVKCNKLDFSQCDNEGVWMKNVGVKASTNTL